MIFSTTYVTQINLQSFRISRLRTQIFVVIGATMTEHVYVLRSLTFYFWKYKYSWLVRESSRFIFMKLSTFPLKATELFFQVIKFDINPENKTSVAPVSDYL
jgi:hypothetical protein